MKEFKLGESIQHTEIKLKNAFYAGRNDKGKIKVIHEVEKPIGIVMQTDYYEEEFIEGGLKK